MVCHDRLTEWDAHPRRSAPSIVDDRILTSCAAVCARMDGWWTLAAGNPHVTRASSRKEELANGIAVLTPKPVLMDRLPDQPPGGDGGIGRSRALARLVACEGAEEGAPMQRILRLARLGHIAIPGPPATRPYTNGGTMKATSSHAPPLATPVIWSRCG